MMTMLRESSIRNFKKVNDFRFLFLGGRHSGWHSGGELLHRILSHQLVASPCNINILELCAKAAGTLVVNCIAGSCHTSQFHPLKYSFIRAVCQGSWHSGGELLHKMLSHQLGTSLCNINILGLRAKVASTLAVNCSTGCCHTSLLPLPVI